MAAGLQPYSNRYRAVIGQLQAIGIRRAIRQALERAGYEPGAERAAEHDVIDVARICTSGGAVNKALAFGGVQKVGFGWVRVVDLRPQAHRAAVRRTGRRTAGSTHQP